MAWPEKDKRKFGAKGYEPNRRHPMPQKTGAQVAAEKAIGGATRIVTSIADNALGGRGTRQALGAIGSIGEAVAEDNLNTKAYKYKFGAKPFSPSGKLAGADNSSPAPITRRTAADDRKPLFEGESDRPFVVMSNRETPQESTDVQVKNASPTAPGAPIADDSSGSVAFIPRGAKPQTNQIGVHLSARDQQIKDNLSAIDNKIALGAKVSPEQAAKIQALREQAGFLRGGTDRKAVDRAGMPIARGARPSAMQVSFDDSVSQEERDAFMRDPVKPSAQIARGAIRPQPVINGIPASLARNVQVRGARPQPINTFTDIMNVKRDMKQQQLDNQTQQVTNDTRKTDDDIRKTGLDAGFKNRELVQGDRRLGIEEAQTASSRALNDQRIAESRQDVRGKEFDLGQKEEISAIQKRLAENQYEDPSLRERDRKLLTEMQGKERKNPQIFYRTETDENGDLIKQPYALNPDGTERPLLGGDGTMNIQNAPADPKDLVDGAYYVTPRGILVWDAEKGKYVKPGYGEQATS